MLTRHPEAVLDFLIGHEPDRNAATVVAVVRLGDYGKTDASRGAHRLAFALHEFLLRHRQPEGRKDLVGFFLVARELDGDVWRAPGHRGLDALLIAAVPQLHERLVVEPQPWNAARIGRPHQRCRGGAECPALCEAYEFV